MTTIEARGLVVPAPARLLTTNAERRLNRYQRAEIVREWRWAAKVEALAIKLPHYEWCSLDVWITQARQPLADVGAHHPVVKAIVDGLVDARVLVDDTPKRVRSIVENAPTKGVTPLVEIRMFGELR